MRWNQKITLALFSSLLLWTPLRAESTEQYEELTVEELSTKCEKLEAKRDALVRAYKEIWKQHMSIQSEIARREAEHNSLQKDHHRLGRQHRRLKLQLAKLQERHKEKESQLKKQIGSLRMELARAKQ